MLISYGNKTCCPTVLVYCLYINLHQVFLNLLVAFAVFVKGMEVLKIIKFY